MLKVIIADDEPHICRLLESLLDWKKEGFSIEGFASNGHEVTKMCVSIRPDLLIIDIRMPGLSGLEVIQGLYKQIPTIKVIIITGYSQFQYAHQALRYGVVDYLLKPIRVDELQAALNKVKELVRNSAFSGISYNNQSVHVKSMKTIKENILFSMISNNQNSLSFTENEQLTEEFYMNFTGDYWRLIQIEIILETDYENFSSEDYFYNKIKEVLEEEFKKEEMELVFTRTEQGYFVLFNGAENSFSTFESHLQMIKFILIQILELFKGIFTIGVSSPYYKFNNIKKCVKECEQAIDQKIVVGKNQIICLGDVPNSIYCVEDFLTDSLKKELKKAIVDLNSTAISKCILELMSTLNLSTRQLHGTLVNEIYEKLIKLFFTSVSVLGINEFDQYSEEQLIAQGKYFYNVTAMFTYLDNLFRATISSLFEEKGEQSTRPIRMAQLYIDEHYKEQIKLQDVAEYVGFTQSYLSSMFKRQVGKSLVEYLTHIRIQKAKQLLIGGEWNIADVAEEVGFLDVKYFIKRFKKITGLTPSEYRKLFGNG